MRIYDQSIVGVKKYRREEVVLEQKFICSVERIIHRTQNTVA